MYSDAKMHIWKKVSPSSTDDIEILTHDNDAVLSITTRGAKMIHQFRTWRDNIDERGQLYDVEFTFDT